jgi:hypothetical protein
LLEKLKLERLPAESKDEDHSSPLNTARRGHFSVLSLPGDDGQSHLDHLRQIGRLWKRLQATK